MWACIKGHFDIVKLLVESGANLDIHDEDVSQIFIICMDMNKSTVLELTMMLYVIKGETAEMVATRNGHTDCAQFIRVSKYTNFHPIS